MRITLRGVSSRFAFFTCGLITFAIGRVHAEWFRLNFTNGPASHESIVLILVAIPTTLVAFVPSSWIGKICDIDPTNRRRSSIPIRMLGGFAVFACVMITGLQLIPTSRYAAVDPALLFLICPACVLTVTVDLSLGTVLLFLAPLNAAVYGAFGGTLGYIVLAICNRLGKTHIRKQT
jgi:hypothetical protein